VTGDVRMDQLEPVQRLKSIADGVYNLHAEFVDKLIYVSELYSQEKKVCSTVFYCDDH
jgi:hypothetical protein